MKKNDPLRLTALAMDARAVKTLSMFLQGPCKNQGILVNESNAEVSFIDLDTFKAQQVLEENLKKYPKRPIIALSLTLQDFPNAIFLKKPVQIESMLKVIAEAKLRLDALEYTANSTDEKPFKPLEEVQKNYSSTQINPVPRQHSSKHKTAISLSEKGFNKYIGSIMDIDIRDQSQVKKVYYDPKYYLQGYVQKALRLAETKNCVLRLNTGWKPITIYPHNREIYVDADDKQLRLICAIPIKSLSSFDALSPGETQGPSVTVVEEKKGQDKHNPKMTQNFESFLWKLALWTSKGRIPIGTNLDSQFHLVRWPNLTRLLIIPHSLRIAALMARTPRTIMNLTEILGIRQQYIFAFFSAAMAIGIVEKVEQQNKTVEISTLTEKPPRHSSNFLGNILRRLRRD